MKPREYGLPHNEWREQQFETLERIQSVYAGSTVVVESPTGSGKTSWAKALAYDNSVVALCKTKMLQQENYGNTYGFDVLYGKGNYRCVYPGVKAGTTASDCKFRPMGKCPVAYACPYLNQKRLCVASPVVSLNYAYWLTTGWGKRHPPSIVVLDEGHELSEITLGWAGCTVTEKDRHEWGLLRFPELAGSRGGLALKAVDPIGPALGWLQDAKARLGDRWKGLQDDSQSNQRKKCERLGLKIRATIDALTFNGTDWYIRSGESALGYGRERRPGLTAKPLTAKYHFPQYFLNGYTTIAMSATIGDVDSYTDELGIKEYENIVVPSRFTPDEKPIYALDVPSMGAKATENDFNHQADEIAKVIKACPSDWCGFILVTRKAESQLLADRLARRGLQDRVWAAPGADGSYVPTDQQIKAWEDRKKAIPNSLCISHSFWLGVNGLDERILILAKIPWPLWGSPGTYEQAWREYSGSRYRWQAACTMAQGAGRTRRGRDGDYDIDGNMNGMVAVADGSWSRLRKYYPRDVQESIVKAS